MNDDSMPNTSQRLIRIRRNFAQAYKLYWVYKRVCVVLEAFRMFLHPAIRGGKIVLAKYLYVEHRLCMFTRVCDFF